MSDLLAAGIRTPSRPDRIFPKWKRDASPLLRTELKHPHDFGTRNSQLPLALSSWGFLVHGQSNHVLYHALIDTSVEATLLWLHKVHYA